MVDEVVPANTVQHTVEAASPITVVSGEGAWCFPLVKAIAVRLMKELEERNTAVARKTPYSVLCTMHQ